MDRQTVPLIDELRREMAALRGDVERLREENHHLREENRQLREQLENAQREAARQAAPFRRRESKKVPDGEKKRPGRPKGHPGSYRAVPAQIDASIEVPLSACPDCGGPVESVEPVVQIIEEIPPVRPHVTHLVTYRGACPRCGVVHSKHP
jgi:transposase